MYKLDCRGFGNSAGGRTSILRFSGNHTGNARLQLLLNIGSHLGSHLKLKDIFRDACRVSKKIHIWKGSGAEKLGAFAGGGRGRVVSLLRGLLTGLDFRAPERQLSCQFLRAFVILWQYFCWAFSFPTFAFIFVVGQVRYYFLAASILLTLSVCFYCLISNSFFGFICLVPWVPVYSFSLLSSQWSLRRA